jgi:2-(1,2-epoxy-1,2-dihydrophenyl)acetyl-CoA isomerase
MATDQQCLTIDRHNAIVIMTFNRPDALNAMNRELAAALLDALREAERDEAVRVIIITGAGRAFCAGQDVHELAMDFAESGPAAVGRQVRERYRPLILRLRAIEKPVIAAINGVATGAGLGIALACDLRIASEQATFVIAPYSIGLIPAVGTTVLLPAIAGLGKATHLLLRGERLSAQEALEAGLVEQVVPAEHLMTETLAVAERLVKLPAKAVGLTKRALNRAMLADLDAHLLYEAELQEIAAGTGDFLEGMAALREKRAPVFQGR